MNEETKDNKKIPWEIDPVFFNRDTKRWYFWDEVWKDFHGPYNSYNDAREACIKYADTI